MQPNTPSGTVTFLFTDIEGSTRYWETSPTAMRDALERHDALMRRTVEAGGGIVFKTVGDAFCAAFNTASQAASAAIDAQLALSGEPWPVEPPLRARMALHTGTADERGGDYYGQPLNRVARLLSAGHGGQILVSLVTEELIRDTLRSEVSLIDLGTATLKDLGRPERVFQLQHAALSSNFPPLRTLDSPELPNNLPQQATSFIGRDRELDAIEKLLATSRLLTLVGAGGAGKTRLALQAAADLLGGESATGGVWLAELAPLTDAKLVAGAVAEAVGVKEAAGQPLQKTLIEALKRKQLLIVLDNCEHLLDACASLAAELLRHCPEVRLLATSREPLGVAGEQIYRIPSLSAPDLRSSGRMSPPTAASLSQYDSVRLFIERAKAAQPAFAVTDANAPAVAQVCAHLDGIPLAIELAAARVRSMPVDQINNRLDQRFRLLTGGARANLPRQQTLRALVDWSYDLLGEQEKLLLARLSIFAGGWTLDAAEAVCGGGGIDEWETLDLLAGLTDKSLVVYDEPDPEGTSVARYRLLETMREYGRERLDGMAGQEALGARHRDWFLQLARQAQDSSSSPEAMSWLARLDEEHDNLRAALHWTEAEQESMRVSSGGIADGNPDEDHEERLSAALGLRLAAALADFWYRRGFFTEGRHWLERMLPAGDVDEARWPRDDLAVVARGLSAAGTLAYSQGDFAEAVRRHTASLRLRRILDDRKGVATVLNSLGNIAYAQGDYTAARARYAESLELRRIESSQTGIAAALGNLGLVLVNTGEYQEAELLLHESLETMRRIGDEQGVAVCLNNLGNLLVNLDRRQEAQARFQESLELARKVGDRRRAANALANLAAGSAAAGSVADADASYRESLEIRAGLEDQAGVTQSLLGIAELALLLERTERAVILWSAAMRLRELLGASHDSQGDASLSRRLGQAEAAMEPRVWNAAVARGRSMTWRQATQFALTDQRDP